VTCDTKVLKRFSFRQGYTEAISRRACPQYALEALVCVRLLPLGVCRRR
jgi:hypothetical protein